MSGSISLQDEPPVQIEPFFTTLKRAFLTWSVAATCCITAETATYPIDVLRTRMQLQNELVKDLPRAGLLKNNLKRMMGESFLSIYTGWTAAALRQAIYGGIGIGLYPPIRKFVIGDTDPQNAPLWKRMLSGFLTGGIGQAIAHPTDLVKTRRQSDAVHGRVPRYTGTLNAFLTIPKVEGIHAFYSGINASIQRAAIINGCGIAAYDHTKNIVAILTGGDDGLKSQFVGALVSGLVSASVSTPFDVVKTRVMNQPVGNSIYKSSLHCAQLTIKNEGFGALYKGFIPSYARLAPWQMVFFLSYEQISRWTGYGKL